MVTRSKIGITRPKKVFVADISGIEPIDVADALSQREWKQAMLDEYNALTRNKTWSLVELPQDRNVVGCKWVFKVKENPDGTIARHKARLVAKGYLQTAGFDYSETFSPVVKPTTIRVVLTIALAKGWVLKQLDVNNAFLNGDLNEEVYMQQPPGFERTGSESLVCRLHKALYGLKQAPRAWFDKLRSFLTQQGFDYSRADQSLYFKFTSSYCIYILVYVDDIIITGSNNTELQSFISILHSQFSLKDLGSLSFFLGIEVKNCKGGVLLSQKKYITDLLKRAKMDDANSLPTPMITSLKLTSDVGDPVDNPHEYRSVVGALQYITITRPEICFSVNKACQFMQNPLDTHWKAVKRILRYLKGTLDDGILLVKSEMLTLTGFSDADWGNDLVDRRSTTGHCVYLGDNLVSWNSKKQHSVSRSSTESEYRSLASVAAEIIWIQTLLSELKIKLPAIPKVWCDNTSTISLSANPVLHNRTKHMEIDLFFLREKVMANQLIVGYVPSLDQVADIFTKPLSTHFFDRLKERLTVTSAP